MNSTLRGRLEALEAKQKAQELPSLSHLSDADLEEGIARLQRKVWAQHNGVPPRLSEFDEWTLGELQAAVSALPHPTRAGLQSLSDDELESQCSLRYALHTAKRRNNCEGMV
jgi:hypothetical protein